MRLLSGKPEQAACIYDGNPVKDRLQGACPTS
jgi:hypothetical protein